MPRALFRLMMAAQQQVLFDNAARSLGDAPEEVKRRHIANCTQWESAYGAGVAKALGLAGRTQAARRTSVFNFSAR